MEGPPSIPQVGDLALLGRGGYSTVYVGWHADLGCNVAVKVLAGLDDPRRQQEFERECSAMGRLSDHPHVVVPLKAGVAGNGGRYLLLEYYPMGSCAHVVGRSGPFGPATATACLSQVGGALMTAHQRGVIHNDVKPENILVKLIGSDPHFSVTDFGLAQLIDGRTQAGATAGSLLYVAPELLEGARPSEACDVYGLSATMCFLVSGRAPIEPLDGESWISLMRRISEEPPQAPLETWFPQPLAHLLRQGLQKDPERRPLLPEVLSGAAQAFPTGPTPLVLRTGTTTRCPVNPSPMDTSADEADEPSSARVASRRAGGLFKSSRVLAYVLTIVILFLVSVALGRML